MGDMLKMFVKNIVRRIGFDIVRYVPKPKAVIERRLRPEMANIDLVVDVGANIGQFAKELRSCGYTGRIVSYEPLSAAYSELESCASGDASWDVRRYAVGDKHGDDTINISRNSYSSSLLPMMPKHVSAAPNSAYVGQESVSVITLDADIDYLSPQAGRVFLKIDTQGYEDRVLAGGKKFISYVSLIQLEMSIVSLYADSLLFDELNDIVRSLGFTMKYMHPVFKDIESGDILQVDVIYSRAV